MTDPIELDDGELATPQVMGQVLRAALTNDIVAITPAGVADMKAEGVDPDGAIEVVKRVAGQDPIIYIRKT